MSNWQDLRGRDFSARMLTHLSYCCRTWMACRMAQKTRPSMLRGIVQRPQQGGGLTACRAMGREQTHS